MVEDEARSDRDREQSTIEIDTFVRARRSTNVFSTAVSSAMHLSSIGRESLSARDVRLSNVDFSLQCKY